MAAAGRARREPELVFTIDKSMAEVLGELRLLVTHGGTRRVTGAGLTVLEERWGLLFAYGTTRCTLWTARLVFEQAGIELRGRVTVDRPRSPFGRAVMVALLDGIRQTVLDIDKDARIIVP